jgi:site-specific recombinase XerD
MLRAFFDRIIEWEWDDAPPRAPMFASDLPKPDDPLPKFLDDADATRLARAIAAETDARTRLVLELLMRTGMRVSEMCALETDAVIRIGDGWWLRVPVGKLHNDRYVPRHPVLVGLLEEWQPSHGDSPSGLLLADQGSVLNRHAVTRMLNRVAKQAGVGHVHPHRLRHTLGTQAVNRGMRLEAVAALLGHQTLQMTARYARIANRTVAAEYQAVTAKVEALYNQPSPLGPEAEGPAMRNIRAEHRRMLANGWCTRPAELDCNFEAICEGCGFFATTIEFKHMPSLPKPNTPPATANNDAKPSTRASWKPLRRRQSHDRPRPTPGTAATANHRRRIRPDPRRSHRHPRCPTGADGPNRPAGPAPRTHQSRRPSPRPDTTTRRRRPRPRPPLDRHRPTTRCQSSHDPRPLRRSHHPKEDAPRPRLTTTRRGRREQPKLPAMGGISRFYLTRWAA